VVLTGRRQGVLEEAVEAIRHQLIASFKEEEEGSKNGSDRTSHRAFCIAADITDYSGISRLVQEAEYLTGIPPTILINNAGINVRQKAESLTSEHWTTSVELMLTAPFMLTRAMSSHMKEQHYGRIVNIASLQSYAAFPDSIPYAACKAGTLGLTRALAEAYSPLHGYENVTCNAIAPGYVKTDLTKPVFDETDRVDRLAAATIAGRNSEPEDLVGAAIWLCSPAGAYVTGQTIPVDGGFSALGLRW
jgi:NAD(P)-dependent dehydrogenase (short-subunit alcohol dehydrogenase family)